MRKFKKKRLMALVLLLIVGCIIGVGVRYSILHTKKHNNSNNHMAIYVPNDNGEVFQLSNLQKIPEGYRLNVEETNAHCSDGLTASWDDTTKTVSINATKSGGCNLYLEKEKITMANYIKEEVYGTDTTLYLHSDTATGNNETSIANWTDAESGNANDGAYRYSGPDASVHNYICFGTSDKDTCLNDTNDNGNSKYLFRIISVEGDNVKLIKALPLYNTKTSAATFGWDYEGSTDTSTYSNSWSKPSTLKEYLNTGTSSRANYSSNYPDTGYLQSWSSDWQSKIADNMTWYIGGYSNYSVKIKTFYNAEHGTCSSGTCPGTTDTSTRVGLMNVYDYGYAAAPTSWTIDTLGNYNNSTIKTSNWLYRSTNSSTEWTITPYSFIAYRVFGVNSTGFVGNSNASYGYYAVRPVFYLTSNVAYKSGTGTSTDPFLVS